jgi:hypothetical protein
MRHIPPTTFEDLTCVFYTSNYLQDSNPHFFNNMTRMLKETIKDTPLISVSQKPMDFGTNVCVGDIGRSNRNLYWQILQGVKAAKTKWIATAEDDIIYSPDHFEYRPKEDVMAYEMNKWSFFTWSDPLVFSWRRRKIINSIICTKELFVNAMEERLAKHPQYLSEEHCGEPGRYDKELGVKEIKTEEYYSSYPIVVYSHEDAYGYLSRGPNKELGPLRATELVGIGNVHQVQSYYDKDYKYGPCPECGQLRSL